MIRTVCGDIAKKEITGNILTHEHVMCTSFDMLHMWGKKWLDLESFAETAAAVYRFLAERYGVSLIVDGTPCDLGRDMELIRRVSEKSGVHIVASTGFYHYPSQLTSSRSAEELADICMEEYKNGVGAAGIKPGILKCAVDYAGVTADCRKRITAMGIMQRETGLPLYAHCHHIENTGHALLDILLENGADPAKIAIGHATSRLEVPYLAGLLDRGCCIDLDQPHCHDMQACVDTVAALTRLGYGKRLLFSLDTPLYSDFESKAHVLRGARIHAERYGLLFDTLLCAFQEAGCTQMDCQRFMQSNAMAYLTV